MKTLGILFAFLTSFSAFASTLRCKYDFIDYRTGRQTSLTKARVIQVSAPGQTQADIQLFVVAGRFNVSSSVIKDESTGGKHHVRIAMTDILKKVTAQTSGNETAELVMSDPSDIRDPQSVDTFFDVRCSVNP